MGLSYGAAPTPDEPAEAVRVAEPDMYGHYYRHAACDRPVGSHGRGCFTVQDLHRIGADVLLAALGHTDCEALRKERWSVVAMRNEALNRAERAEAELAEVHRVLDEGSVEPGGTAAIVQQRADEHRRVVEENAALAEERDRLREAIRGHREVWDRAVGHGGTAEQRRHDANDDLWAALDREEQ